MAAESGAVPASGPLTFHKVAYTKRDLSAASEDETVLFLVCAQIYNDVSLTFRLILQHRAPSGSLQPITWAASEAQLFLIRMLAGRCHEGSKFLASNNRRILDVFGQEMTDEQRSALKEITRYFGGESLLSKVRNKLAFHLDADVIRDAYRQTPDDEPLYDCHQIMRGNTIFYSAESMFVRTLAGLTGIDDLQSALNELLEHSLKVAGAFMDATGGVAAAYCARYLSRQLDNMTTIVVPDQPNPEVTTARPFVFVPGRGIARSPRRRRLLASSSRLPLPDGGLKWA